MASDETIFQKTQYILNIIHHPNHGIYDANLNVNRLSKRRHKHPMDLKFSLTGQEILVKRLGKAVGCTGYSKAFLFLARKLNLDAVGIVTISVESYLALSDKKNHSFKENIPLDGHVIIGLRLNDNQLHMLDATQEKLTVFGNVPTEGMLMHHIIPDIQNKPYLITAITPNLEQIKCFEHMRNISVSGKIDDACCKFDPTTLHKNLKTSCSFKNPKLFEIQRN